VLKRVKFPILLDGLFGARDNDGIETEKEPAQGDNNRPDYNFALDHNKKICIEGLPNITFIRYVACRVADFIGWGARVVNDKGKIQQLVIAVKVVF